jgi:hypothetical protein
MPRDRALCIEKPPGCLGGSKRSRGLMPRAATGVVGRSFLFGRPVGGRSVRFFVVLRERKMKANARGLHALG